MSTLDRDRAEMIAALADQLDVPVADLERLDDQALHDLALAEWELDEELG
jgi:hypothetical protein